jgi:hypothetical protein
VSRIDRGFGLDPYLMLLVAFSVGIGDEQGRGTAPSESRDAQPTSTSTGSMASPSDNRATAAGVRSTATTAKSASDGQSDDHLIIDDVDTELKKLIQQSMQPGGGSQAVSVHHSACHGDSKLTTTNPF